MLNVELVLTNSFVLSHTILLPVGHLVRIPHLTIYLMRETGGTHIYLVVGVRLPVVIVFTHIGGEETVAGGRQN